MHPVFLVAVGGALGAVGRYGLAVFIDERVQGRFPAGTLVVNVLGCLALGALMAAAEGTELSPRVRLALGPGVLGAFTTFSTFSVETLALLREGRAGAALLSVGANLLLGLLAAALGHLLTERLLA